MNGASEISVAIGRYYAEQRGVPGENLLRLELPVPDPTLTTPHHENVARADFERRVRDPIARFLSERGAALTVQRAAL